MSGIVFRYLAYLGPDKVPAEISLKPGLNVICGASETGKSYIVETIDFMLGQEAPVRDIPERAGYDRIRMLIESEGWPPLALERSIEGGNFRIYDEGLSKTLKWKHSAARQDTLSHELLERIGLTSKRLRRNSQNDTRSLSFRDIARLTVVSEEEIQTRGSPFLSGQYTTATPEYAALKLLLTGTDDSALVSSADTSPTRGSEAGKVELLDQWIQELQTDIDEDGVEKDELDDQLSRLDSSIAEQNTALLNIQKSLNLIMEQRGAAAKELRSHRERLLEIAEFISRFRLLDAHYETDLKRLNAVHESGSLFFHLEAKTCPLCGSETSNQHLDKDCDGNTKAVVQAAEAEMLKIEHLRRELAETVKSLEREQGRIGIALPQFESTYESHDRELSEVAAPTLTQERASYNTLISKRAQVRTVLEKFDRLKRLTAQRDELQTAGIEFSSNAAGGRTLISKRVLDEFSQTVQQILIDWNFPNAGRVFFEETKRDFQISGKERGSTGKGLRAVTHAAAKIGLMVFCRENHLPHPGFVVLDSPLLAYWKPEGVEDDLRGSDLKDRFYEYLIGLHSDNQVIIVENEHPPGFIVEVSNVIIFTKNPHQGRYGLFPPKR